MSDVATESGQQPGSSSPGTEHGQAVTVPEYLVGEVDAKTYAALPAEARDALANTVKSLKGSYTKKSQEVAELRKLKEQLDADPDRADYLRRSLADYDAGRRGVKSVAAEAAKEAKSRLDGILEEIDDPGSRKRIKEFVESLDERYQGKLGTYEQELKEVKDTLKGLQSTTHASRRETLKSQLAQLPKPLRELAESHEEQILRLGVHPSGQQHSARKLIQIVADAEAYEAALKAVSSETKSDEVAKVRQTATSKPGAQVASVDTLLAKEDFTKPRGRYGPQVKVENVMQKLVRELKQGMPH